MISEEMSFESCPPIRSRLNNKQEIVKKINKRFNILKERKLEKGKKIVLEYGR